MISVEWLIRYKSVDSIVEVVGTWIDKIYDKSEIIREIVTQLDESIQYD